MTELPRARALVRLDGPGHIMPVEPVTPSGSTIWRVVHFPVILGAVALALLLLASFATTLIGFAFRFAGHMPGARFLAPLTGAAAVLCVYWVFVRVVERRRELAELGGGGWLREIALAYGAGLSLAAGIFAIVYALGGLQVVGFDSPHVLIAPFVSAACAAVVQEVIARGLFFRLVERLLGSWLALLLMAAGFGAAAFLFAQAAPFAGLAIVLEAGLMFTAAYMATRRLWGAIGLHAAWNFAQVALYGVAGTAAGPPGAGTAAGPHGFVRSLATGPDWLTGARAGVDASLPALAVTALLVAALLTVAIRRGYIVRPVWRRGRR